MIKSIFGGEQEVETPKEEIDIKEIVGTQEVRVKEAGKIVKEPKGINKHPKGINSTETKKVAETLVTEEKTPSKKIKIKRAWFNNGVKQKLIPLNKKPEEGWRKGRLVRKVKKDK